MTPEYGAATQLEKIDMLDFADVVAVNKADRRGADDAMRDVRRQVRRNRGVFEVPDGDLPVVATIASRFNDDGTQRLYEWIMRTVGERFPDAIGTVNHREGRTGGDPIIPRSRVRYLSEIADAIHTYDQRAERSAVAAGNLQAVERASALAPQATLGELVDELRADVPENLLVSLEMWDAEVEVHAGGDVAYEVRGREIVVGNEIETMSGTTFPKVIHARFDGWADRVRWLSQENLPGRFPR